MSLKKLSCLAVIFLFSIALVSGQIRVEIKNVYMPVLVFDGNKAVVLTKDNFRVFEGEKSADGKNIIWAEQDLLSFERYDNRPIALALAVDASGSMSPVFYKGLVVQEDKFTQAKNAALEVLRSVFRQGEDEGLVGRIFYETRTISEEELQKSLSSVPSNLNREFFVQGGYHYFIRKKKYGEKWWMESTTSLVINQDWTNDISKIQTGIASIGKTIGGTPLRDGVFYLAKHFSLAPKDSFRVVVLFTDGEDTIDGRPGQTKVGVHELDEVIAELQNNQILVYGIGTYKKDFFGLGFKKPDFLEKVTEATGGVAFYETDLSKVNDIARNIGATIRNTNFLSYEPKSDNEGVRLLRVEVGEWDAQGKWHKKNYTLFHRKGYFYKK